MNDPLAKPQSGARVYISGPMTGKDNHNIEAFNAAKKLLVDAGYNAVNPVDINNLLTNQQRQNYSECLRYDFKELVDCDCIYMLKGWQYSNGARIELDIALNLGLTVFFE